MRKKVIFSIHSSRIHSLWRVPDQQHLYTIQLDFLTVLFLYIQCEDEEVEGKMERERGRDKPIDRQVNRSGKT